jgi:hypothetical protein
VTRYWIPAYGHPDGMSSEPWFRIEGAVGYRDQGHPEGPSEQPALRIDGTLVYAALGLPDDDPVFEAIGSFVYVIGAPGAPWFVDRDRTGATP